ncbi:hypothetical protein BS50DRAFT_600044 [Corynespora cassiicola Philippines]|uniref:Chalcone isomerase domain-containing protein n=1 Tax=Corynespora cassiicola Philippines TaxID=1448308 RepID=A0A2T2NRM3_CORCC|nr:hypothetical protein BS50DRAFT_600044 [Corynespora cassiicola Philippines]
MMSARLALRRPVARCFNNPAPRPQLRQLHHEQIPKTKAEAERLLNDSVGKAGPKGVPDINHVSVHRAEAMRRAYYIRRRNWLALGAALSMIAPIFLVRLWDVPLPEEKEKDENKDQSKDEKESRGILDMINPRPPQADAPRKAAEEFQGKKVVIAAGDKVIAAPDSSENPMATDADAIELVETGTSYVPYFPRTIKLPTSTGPEAVESEAEYTLLGLGIRKVSFLRVQVYVVGLYVRTSSLGALQNHLIKTVNPSASALIPGEKEDLRKALVDSEKSNEIWESILSRKGTDGVDLAIRIVPTRGTDFKHLQDGLMRGIASRTDEVKRKQAELLRQQAAESKQISLPKPVEEGEFEDESFGLAMKDFKALFQGRGKAPKGSVLILTKDRQGTLGALYQPIIKSNKGEQMGEVVKMGTVQDERVSRLVYLLYLGGQNVSSEEARKNIVDGCIGITERPVGTVEGMVQ